MKPIETVLIGFGASARIFQAPHLHSMKEFHFRGVLERSSDLARATYPNLHLYRTVEEVLKDPGVELVIISTPNHTHFSLAERFLKKGLHVVVEKPFTVTFQEATKLITLAQKKNLVLSVFHNRRWDGDFLGISRLIGSGDLGRIVSLESRFERFSNSIRKKAWKETPNQGSSLLEDLGSHLIDQAVLLFGKPMTVFCRQGIERDNSQVPDAFTIFLQYPQTLVTLKAGMMSVSSPFRFLVQGSEGSFCKKNLDPQETRLSLGVDPLSKNIGQEEQNHWGELTKKSGETHRLETPPGYYKGYFTELFSCLRSGGANPVPPESGAIVIKILEACRASAKSGKTIAFK